MKWRKQMTAMWDDERVARLVKSGGVEGLAAFGMYCRVLDIVASQMDGKTASCSVTYDVSRWSLLLSLRGSHVRHWFEKLALTTLVTVEWMGTEIKVTIPKLLKYRDEYSLKSGQTPPKEQNRTDTEQTQTDDAPTVAEMKRSMKPAEKPLAEEIADWFNGEFWPDWVKASNDSKGAALKAAKAKAKTEAIRSEIMAGAKSQSESRMHHDPQYRSHCSTWLNQERWKDQSEPVLFAQSNGKIHDPSNTEYRD